MSIQFSYTTGISIQYYYIIVGIVLPILKTACGTYDSALYMSLYSFFDIQ